MSLIRRAAIRGALGLGTAALMLRGDLAEAAPAPTPKPTGLPSEITVLSPSGGNDSAQFQAAVDRFASAGHSGDIWFNTGSMGYRFDQTVLVPRPSVSGIVINLRGIGRPVFTGQADPLVRIEGQWGFAVDNLVFQGSGRRGVGLWLSREGAGYGTAGGQAILSRVAFGDFSTGCRLGSEAGGAVSEILFADCAAGNCGVGFEAFDYNTCDLKFDMLNLDQNDYGVWTNQAGMISVDGGSASASAIADFRLGAGGVYSINNFRSEHANRFFLGGTTTATTAVALRSCDVSAPANPDRIVIEGHWGDGLLVDSCDLGGMIGWSQVYGTTPGSPGRLTLINTSVGGDQLFLNAPDATGLLYSAMGCRSRNPDNTVKAHFPDQSGIVRGGKIVPLWQAPTA